MSTKEFKVGEIQGNFYGGLPYSATWNFNDGSSPSTLQISVVNESGNYPEISDDDLTYTTTTSITLGEFTFEGYLEGYTIEKTPSQKILNLEYIDKSSDLDRYYVGLNKRHGEGTNMILVGAEENPCKPGPNRETDGVDPCDPCPEAAQNIDGSGGPCDKQRLDFEIWEVFYTFGELISKLSTVGITVAQSEETSKLIGDSFRAQHTGKLKDVLSSWCSDIGLAYYWDVFNNQLVFVDRREPISIPDDLEDTDNIIDFTYGRTKKGTFSRGFCGYFAKKGELKSYSCEADRQSRIVDCEPLTIADLLVTDAESAGNFVDSREVRAQEARNVVYYEIQCLLSKFGRPLRDAYMWFYFHGMTTVNNVALARCVPQVEKVIPFMGNMRILEVIHPTVEYNTQSSPGSIISKGKIEPEAFRAVTNALSGGADSNSVDSFTKFSQADAAAAATGRAGEETYTASNPSWYYIIAECDNELASKIYEINNNWAQNYLGRFWYKSYPAPFATNRVYKSSVSLDVPDGSSANWYRADEDLSMLEIFKFGHKPTSKVDKLAKQNREQSQSARNSGNGPVLKAMQSFALIDRKAKYVPADEDINKYDALFKFYEEHVPKMIDVDGRPEILMRMYPKAEKNKNIRLFIARQWKGFRIKVDNANHPLEPTGPSRKQEERNGTIVTLGTYGLINPRTIRLTIGHSYFAKDMDTMEASDMVIYAPVGSIRPYGSNESITTFNAYTVIDAEQSRLEKIIPKVQFSVVINPDSTDVSSLDYHYKQIQEQDAKELIKDDTPIQLGGRSINKCEPDKNKITTLAKKVGSQSAYSMSSVRKTATMKLPGIVPVMFGIEDALNSLNINITENGSYTTYTFEDKIIQIPSESYREQAMKDAARPLNSMSSYRMGHEEINKILGR